MFLFYREQNTLLCDILKPVYSITEVLTTMGLCVWDSFNYNIIICIILFLLLITLLKYYK